MIWHEVIRELTHDYTVVTTDLRGYDTSSGSTGSARHVGYSERIMTQDQAEVMCVLGPGRFRLCAHDRGVRVTRRLCVDYPLRVEHAILLDIAPTLTMYEHTNMAFAPVY